MCDELNWTRLDMVRVGLQLLHIYSFVVQTGQTFIKLARLNIFYLNIMEPGTQRGVAYAYLHNNLLQTTIGQ